MCLRGKNRPRSDEILINESAWEEMTCLFAPSLGNTTATFREGQWEAIDAVVNQRRKLLVVQRTGWGKSAVYFIASKIFRDRGAGPTIIISPLLALMRNQVAAAERLGITAETLNSTNREEWQRISDKLLQGEVDCLLVSPTFGKPRLYRNGFISYSRSYWLACGRRGALHL